MSMPLLPLPQGKTVYLGNGNPAPFPGHEMNHVHGNQPSHRPEHHHLPLKQKKGKSKMQYDRQGDNTAYSNLINLTTSIDFIPPEKLVIPKQAIISEAQKLLSPHSHHALFRAYKILCDEKPWQDGLDGETWTHKFRPRRADEILCGNTSGIELRDWMEGKRKVILTSAIPEEMDDFIVDDDDVSDDPISEMDDDSPQKRRSRKKELFVSYSNVVILAGPHGVGKSAAVHAVAEELGYQVFEISPGSRRGWKEVMEAVGEVGQSELVTRHKGVTTESSLAPLKLGDPRLGELKSRGRKGLVCFDEVDVLYEEDKRFWTCVTGLVEKSRRPVIITCNGISLPLVY
jgi:hypothetical protein